MPKVKYSRLVPLPRKRVYALMMDIEKYPLFIPFVTAARFLERDGRVSRAEIGIGLGHIGFTYTCRIEETPFMEIRIREESGPFEYLRTRLTFAEKGKDATEVGYDFESRFRSRAMNALADPVFNVVLRSTLEDVEDYVRRNLVD